MSSDVQVFVPIEERHGDGCTCRSAGRIELDLVMASRACPGDRNPHRAGSITAQLKSFEPEPYPGIGIDITWPPPVGNGGGMTTHRMLANDHATGQPLLAITGLRIVLGGDQWDAEVIKADIKTFVNADGQPLMGPGAPVVRDPEDPERFYSKVFRCYVVEMRVLPTSEAAYHRLAADEMPHNHLFARDMTGRCRCGLTAEEYERLRADEDAGRPHASQTTKPVDQHGRAIKENRP